VFSVESIEPPGNLTATISSNDFLNLYPAENWSTLKPVMVTIGVTDGLSYDTASFNVTVRPDDDPPAIDPIGTITGKANEQVAFTVIAHDADGDTLFFTDDTDIFDIEPYTGEVNFTVNDTNAGVHSIKITVSDGQNQRSITFTLELRPRDNMPPVLEHIEPIKAMVGRSIKVELRATDQDGDKLTFFMDPPLFEITHLSDTSAQIAFTPNANDVMEQDVFIMVSDGVETDSQKVSIIILGEDASESQGFLDNLDPMLLLYILIPIIVIIVVALIFMKRKSQSERDLQMWESMAGEREAGHEKTVEDLGPLDREELKREKSIIEEELMDPGLQARDKPVIYEAQVTEVSSVPEAPPVIAEEEVPELSSEKEVPELYADDELPQLPEASEPEVAAAPAPVKKTVKKKKKKKAE
jgi:hypothetical protein